MAHLPTFTADILRERIVLTLAANQTAPGVRGMLIRDLTDQVIALHGNPMERPRSSEDVGRLRSRVGKVARLLTQSNAVELTGAGKGNTYRYVPVMERQDRAAVAAETARLGKMDDCMLTFFSARNVSAERTGTPGRLDVDSSSLRAYLARCVADGDTLARVNSGLSDVHNQLSNNGTN